MSSFTVEDIFRAITTMAGALVTSSLDAIPRVLGILGQTIDADRILLVESRRDESQGFAGLLHSFWQAPGGQLSASSELLPELPADLPGVSEWLPALSTGEPIEVHRQTAPVEARDTFERRGVESLLLVPINADAKLWGCLAIESASQRAWERPAIEAFKAAADLVGAAISRDRHALESEQRVRTIFSSVNDGIFVIAPHSGKIIDVNPAGCEMFGYSQDEMIGRDITRFSAGVRPYAAKAARGVVQEVLGGRRRTLEWHCRAKDGRLFWGELSVRSAVFGNRNVILTTVRDITERKGAQEQLLRMALYDSLTGLPNRTMFVEALHAAVERGRHGSGGFAVLYLDLDRFKDVNDTLGHPAGDRLLQGVARRLRSSVRRGDTVARFGGDEFAVLATGIAEPADAAAIGENILAALAEPLRIAGSEIRTSASIGIAVYGENAPDAESILSHADVALYQSKNERSGGYCFFTQRMNDDVKRRVVLTDELRLGIDSGQLFLVYQPQVALSNGAITGLEALVRWQHPERGVISPNDFIPIAEASGLIIPLGRWVIREACRQAKQWLDSGIDLPLVAVNLSGIQFRSPREVERDIEEALAETGLPPHYLQLEFTESVLMNVSHQHQDVIERLRERGIGLAIDDFGTGYSSLDYLHRYKVDRIKIAQAFVTDLAPGTGAAAIVKAAIGLGRELNLNVIAEGIETPEQAVLLRQWGCGEGQGFYFARPQSACDVGRLLSGGDNLPASRNGNLRQNAHLIEPSNAFDLVTDSF